MYSANLSKHRLVMADHDSFMLYTRDRQNWFLWIDVYLGFLLKKKRNIFIFHNTYFYQIIHIANIN